MKKVPMSIYYDNMADVLHLSFGKNRAAISVEVNDGDDFVRVEPFTDKVVGFTILNFKERFMENE